MKRTLIIVGSILVGGLLIYGLVKVVKPSTTTAGASASGTATPPLPTGAQITVGTRSFVIKPNGIAINSQSNSQKLQSSIIPFPKYTNGSYVSASTPNNDVALYIRVYAASLGDGCGYSHDDIQNSYNQLIADGVTNVPTNF